METKAIMVDVLPGRRARQLRPTLRAGEIVAAATPGGDNTPDETSRDGGGG
jgi:hypothetical protein